MAERTTAGYLTNSSGAKSNATATTGRFLVNLPHMPSVTLLFIDIVSGTASIDIEVRDGRSTGYIPVRTITSDAVVKLSLPSATIACNITANTGSVTITFRSIVVESIPSVAIEVFTGGIIEPATISTTGTVTSTLVDIQKRLYGPAQPGLVAATLYTVPAGKKTTLELIHIVNTTGTTATITLSIGADSAATRLLSAYPIQANGILTLPCAFTLVAAEIIQGLQGTGSALTATLNGTETTV